MHTGRLPEAGMEVQCIFALCWRRLQTGGNCGWLAGTGRNMYCVGLEVQHCRWPKVERGSPYAANPSGLRSRLAHPQPSTCILPRFPHAEGLAEHPSCQELWTIWTLWILWTTFLPSSVRPSDRSPVPPRPDPRSLVSSCFLLPAIRILRRPSNVWQQRPACNCSPRCHKPIFSASYRLSPEACCLSTCLLRTA
jgi:hypothetical protein